MNAFVIPSSRSFLLLFLSSLCPLCLCGESSAGSDISGPYRLQVVLRFGDHRAFTPVFKQQVEDGLRDNLRAAFGGLAEVEVVRTHPRLAEVEKNLQALDSWNEVSNVKTHFVLIDYVDNTYYQVQARQYDGLTGQASPVIRRERTTERPFLARAISFLIDQDFGIIGEITNTSDKTHADVTLKGAGLGKSLDRWVKVGDVFRVVEIAGRGSEKAYAVPDALLQVESQADKNGVIKCRLHARYKNPLKPAPGSLGFRCIKLGTTKAPLRLRLMLKGARPPKPLNAYPIHAHRQSFESPGAKEGASHSDGFTSLLGEFENVAFVVIYKPQSGKQEPLARVPVPILDDRPVTIALSIQQEAATPLLMAQANWVERINEVYLTNKERFTELSEGAKKTQPDELLRQALQFLTDLRADIDNLDKERQDLLEKQKDTPEIKLDLKEGDQGIARLKQDRDELDKFVQGQRDVIEQANDPKRQEFLNMVVQARALEEGENDYEQAIKLYEKAQEGLNDANLAKKIEKLKKAWEIKGPEHKEARDFIYKEWPAAFNVNTLRQLKDRIDRARQMFEVCRKKEDPLTVKKLVATAIAHQEKLKAILKTLHGDVNEEQAKPQEEGTAASEALAALLGEVSAYLQEILKDK
jgi:hypothetical protein